MRRLIALGLLVRHGYRLWRSGQARFRLETFGLYYPELPYRSPAWRISARSLLLLLRRLPSYARWVAEMESIKRGGGSSWWSRHKR